MENMELKKEEAESMEQTEQITYPWLIFKLEEGYYAINSKLVSTIIHFPEQVVPVPNAPGYMRGLFDLRGGIVPLVDLRALFGMKLRSQEYEEFAEMLEHRKQDHLNWVGALKHSAEQKTPFTLATDPHQCTFGKWYDQFESKDTTVNYHMRKIDEPHQKLHASALEVANCEHKCDTCNRKECLKVTFDHLTKEYVPRIVALLDEAKEVFRTSYKEMVIVIEKDAKHYGMVADEIVAVEDLPDKADYDTSGGVKLPGYIKELKQGTGDIDKNILVIEDTALINSIESQFMTPAAPML